MKKILTLSLMICFVLACCPIFVACNAPLEPINLTIANYSKYQSLTVGVEAEPTSTVSGMSFMSNTTQNKKPQLIGKRADGSFEKISFEEEQEGKTITNNYGIMSAYSMGDFLFLTYVRNYTGKVYNEHSNLFSSDNSHYTFVLEKTSGKMFDITQENLEISCGSSTSGVSENSFFATSWMKNKIFRYTIVDGQLEANEILDKNKFTDFGNEFFVDRYNNIYSKNGYMISASGKMSSISTSFKIAKNNIVYVDNKWVNATGELEDATFIPNDFTNLNYTYTSYSNQMSSFVNERFLVFKEGNVSYYRNYNESPDCSKIYKYEFINDIEYTVEVINLEQFETNQGIILNDRIYFLNGTEVYYTNIKTGEATSISSEYFFNKIYTNNQGEIIFEGVDSYLDDVIGVISINDTVSVGVTPKQFEIYYIEAINWNENY